MIPESYYDIIYAFRNGAKFPGQIKEILPEIEKILERNVTTDANESVNPKPIEDVGELEEAAVFFSKNMLAKFKQDRLVEAILKGLATPKGRKAFEEFWQHTIPVDTKISHEWHGYG